MNEGPFPGRVFGDAAPIEDRVPQTDCKRGDDDATTLVLRRRVTGSNISAKWCGVPLIAQLHSMKRLESQTRRLVPRFT
jgi:hypothetical protein